MLLWKATYPVTHEQHKLTVFEMRTQNFVVGERAAIAERVG